MKNDGVSKKQSNGKCSLRTDITVFAKYRNVPSTIQKAPFASYFELLRSQQTAFWCLKLDLVQNQLYCTFQKAFTVEILPLEIVGMVEFAQETDLCMQRKMICFFNKDHRLIEPYFSIREIYFTGFSIQNLLSHLFEGADMVLGKQDEKV